MDDGSSDILTVGGVLEVLLGTGPTGHTGPAGPTGPPSLPPSLADYLLHIRFSQDSLLPGKPLARQLKLISLLLRTSSVSRRREDAQCQPIAGEATSVRPVAVKGTIQLANGVTEDRRCRG